VNDGYFGPPQKLAPVLNASEVWAKVLMEVPVKKVSNHFKTG